MRIIDSTAGLRPSKGGHSRKLWDAWALADGSTRSLSENIAAEVFTNLCRKADGNILGEL